MDRCPAPSTDQPNDREPHLASYVELVLPDASDLRRGRHGSGCFILDAGFLVKKEARGLAADDQEDPHEVADTAKLHPPRMETRVQRRAEPARRRAHLPPGCPSAATSGVPRRTGGAWS